MKKLIMRFLSAMLVLVLLIPMAPVAHAADAGGASYKDVYASVEKQVKEFAKSIYYAGADDDALWALAKHGLVNRTTLKAGKTHALTVMMYNSNFLQNYLIKSLMAMINYPIDPGVDTVYAKGVTDCAPTSRYQKTTLYYNADYSDAGKRLLADHYTGAQNSYDTALEWMVGSFSARFTVTRTSSKQDTISYSVKVVISDRFDFRGDNGSVSKDVASILGSVLFREFDWESTVTLNLTVPNPCDHLPNEYHFTYDSNTKEFITDVSGRYASNTMERIPFTDKNGAAQNYYKLERTLFLMHDKPWIMEYTVQNFKGYIMTDQRSGGDWRPFLRTPAMTYMVFCVKELDEAGKIVDQRYYGTKLSSKLLSNKDDRITYRLENVVFDDGSNMIYLTVRNETRDEIVAEKVPLNNRYDVSQKLLETETNGISGWDIWVNYIGNTSYPFNADYYELKVWENSPGMTQEEYLIHKVVKPTCSARGYTAHTCPVCGYSYNTNYVNALAHKFGQYVSDKNATCTKDGTKTAKCSGCSATDTVADVGSAAGHKFEGGFCTVCSEKDPSVISGDFNGDDLVTDKDAIYLLWHTLFPAEYPLQGSGDLNGDGLITDKDAIYLLWHTLFPEEYPLHTKKS